MQIRKITCIQLGGEFPDLLYRTVMPDYGLPVIATILADAGYDVKVFMEHIKPPQWDQIAESDLVCFSSLNAGAHKIYKLASEIRGKLGIPTIVGGTHATYFPESCLEHCDYVVFGEGDETILDLVRTLERDGDLAAVAGIAYLRDGHIHRTLPRPGPAQFDTAPKYDLIDGYHRLSLLDMIRQRRVSWIPVQSSRGCHFKCTFCIVNTMMPTGYRKRDIEAVIADLHDKRRYGRELLFVDNDFAQHHAYTKRLLRRMIEERFDFNILVFARVEAARDDELLALMRKAGITQVYQGYESIQPDTLTAYAKHQTYKQIVGAIGKLHAAGLHIAGSFVLGADTDTLDSIARTAEFVVEQKLAMAYFFPLWGHFPEQINGYRTIVPWYRSIFRGWPYCDGNFVTHFPRNMTPSQLQRAVMNAYRRVCGPAQWLNALHDGEYWVAKWRLLHRIVWRDMERALHEHIGFLEELEDGLYDAAGCLRESVLIERVAKDPRWTFQAGNRAVETLGLSPLELPIPRERNITCVPPMPNSVVAG